MANTNEKLNLPIVNAIEDLKASNKDNRERLQKSMRDGLLAVRKSVDGLNTNFVKAFELAKIQAAFDREQAREDSRKTTKDVQKKATKSKGDDSGMGFFGWAGVVGAITVGIATFTAGFLAGLSASLKTYSAKYTKWIAGLAKNLRALTFGVMLRVNTVIFQMKNMLNSVVNTFKNSKVLAMFRDSKVFSAIFQPILTALRHLRRMAQAFGSISGLVSKVGGMFGGITSFFKNAFATLTKFSWVAKLMGSLGRVLGRVFIPITIIMQAWEAVTGFIDGFANTQGNMLYKIVGGLFGAIKNLAIFIVGFPLDLVKDLISWIGGALGFENFEKVLDSFSFSDMIGGLIDTIKDGLFKVFDWIGLIFSDPLTALKQLWDGYVGTVSSIAEVLMIPIDSAINWVMEKFGWKSEDAPDFNLVEFMSGVFDDVWNSITGMFDPLIKFFKEFDIRQFLTAGQIKVLSWLGILDEKKKATPEAASAVTPTIEPQDQMGGMTKWQKGRAAHLKKFQSENDLSDDEMSNLNNMDRKDRLRIKSRINSERGLTPRLEKLLTEGTDINSKSKSSGQSAPIIIAPSNTQVDNSSKSMSQSNVNVKPNAGRGKIDPAAAYNLQPAF